MFFLNIIILTQFIIILDSWRTFYKSINFLKSLKMTNQYSDLNNFDALNNNSEVIFPDPVDPYIIINYSNFLKRQIITEEFVRTNKNLGNSIIYNISRPKEYKYLINKTCYEGHDMRNISEKYVSLYDIKKNLLKKEILKSLENSNNSINQKLEIIDSYNKVNNDTDSNLFFSKISSINLKNGGLFKDWNFTY